MPVFQKNFQKFTRSEYSDRVYNILQKLLNYSDILSHTKRTPSFTPSLK